MPKSFIFVTIVALTLVLPGCKTLLNANFNADTVGVPPATSPAGPPSDDRLDIQGSDNSIVVVFSDALSSKAVKIDRTSAPPATIFEGFPGGGPLRSGHYKIEYKAYSEADQTGLAISLLSKAGRKALILVYKNGRYQLTSGNGTETLAGTYPPLSEHAIFIEVDLKRRYFMLVIDPWQSRIRRPFIDVTFSDLYALRFAYSEAILEALPGIYIVDDLEIKGIKW